MARLVLALALASACRGPSEGTRAKPASAGVFTGRDGGAPGQLPGVRALFTDPRLVRAAELARGHDDGQVAAAIAETRSQVVLTESEACAWNYAEGRYAMAAELLPQALAAFDRAAAPECSLAGYARLRGAQLYSRMGQVDLSRARASEVPPELPVQEEVHALIAEALYARGEPGRAVEEWRALRSAHPRGARWVETSVRLANALLDAGVVGAADAGAKGLLEEALELATSVIADAPRVESSSGARAARQRALSLLERPEPAGTTAPLPDDVRCRQAQAFLDSGDNTRAQAAAAALRSGRTSPLAPDLDCKAAVIRAQAMVRARTAGAADAWGDALTACDGRELQATAMFGGAKASAQAGRTDEALTRYAALQATFPKHRFADDARFHQGLIALDRGDESTFATLMTGLPDAYPEGDMGNEALFRVALANMVRGRWEVAIAPLERIAKRSSEDHHWATAGRAAYFLGRASLARGDVADARARWRRVLEEHPLTFYMTQAYARLAEQDLGAARGALQEILARDAAPAPLYSRDHAALASPSFARAIRLLEVGEVELARRELGVAGCTGEGVDPEVSWTVAHAFNAAGFPELGHGLARLRPAPHLAHYPVGRWRVPWELAYPRAFETTVLTESLKHGVSPALTWGIMREESGFVADARSSSNAFGLMQLVVPTARGVARGTGLGADERSLKRPDVSVALGTKLLAQLRASYAANPTLAIPAYNGGGGAVGRWVSARGTLDFDLWVETIPYEETRGYTKRVLASEAAYAFLYAQNALDEVLLIPPRVARAGASASAE